MSEEQLFVFAVDLTGHPIRNAGQALKRKYYYVLKHYVEECITSAYADNRLELYRAFLLQDDGEVLDYKKCEKAMVTCRFRPWRRQYKLWLVCDLALITGDLDVCRKAVELMKAATNQKQGEGLDDLVKYLESRERPQKTSALENAAYLMQQYWINENFQNAPEKRIVVTANMSAGKSTLINALAGKDLARTAQEACTGNICYFYNLPFDDGTVHFKGKELGFSSSEDEYKAFGWDSEVAFAVAFFRACAGTDRICLIDTPGVNSAISREHGRISKKCIREEAYDQVIYILNANKLGSDEEIAYLKWISKNVPAGKVIFVLNKLDDFKSSEDSIASSMESVRSDLEKLGYDHPVIFPISAYFGYLLKREKQGKTLTEDEADELAFLKKKFLKAEYNLSAFYGESHCGNDFEGYMKRSGLYYLEKKLYGGQL